MQCELNVHCCIYVDASDFYTGIEKKTWLLMCSALVFINLLTPPKHPRCARSHPRCSGWCFSLCGKGPASIIPSPCRLMISLLLKTCMHFVQHEPQCKTSTAPCLLYSLLTQQTHDSCLDMDVMATAHCMKTKILLSLAVLTSFQIYRSLPMDRDLHSTVCTALL